MKNFMKTIKESCRKKMHLSNSLDKGGGEQIEE